MQVLENHLAVLKDPEPWVLVDSLGSATVNLRICFLLDGSQHRWLKVLSAVIRLVKRSFQSAGISMPDEVRDLIFPDEVLVCRIGPDQGKQVGKAAVASITSGQKEESASVETGTEGGLRSEAGEIQVQANLSLRPEE